MNSNQSEPRVGIVILTCNQCNLTLDCLQSLYKIDYKNWFALVVDNGSTDGTAEAIKENFPDVKLIINSSNLGVAGGRNKGISEALAGGARWILLLDNDTLVDQKFLHELVKVGESDPRIGGVSPKIYYAGHKHLLDHAGGVFHRIVFHTCSLGGLQQDRGQYNEIKDIDWISGCAGLFRREIFKKVGFLDDNLSPLGMLEDIDFSLRIKNSGFRLLLAPLAYVYHRRAPGKGLDIDRIEYAVYGRFLLLCKHSRLHERILGLAWLLLHSMLYIPFLYIIRNNGSKKFIFIRYYSNIFKGFYNGFKEKSRMLF